MLGIQLKNIPTDYVIIQHTAPQPAWCPNNHSGAGRRGHNFFLFEKWSIYSVSQSPEFLF